MFGFPALPYIKLTDYFSVFYRLLTSSVPASTAGILAPPGRCLNLAFLPGGIRRILFGKIQFRGAQLLIRHSLILSGGWDRAESNSVKGEYAAD